MGKTPLESSQLRQTHNNEYHSWGYQKNQGKRNSSTLKITKRDKKLGKMGSKHPEKYKMVQIPKSLSWLFIAKITINLFTAGYPCRVV